MQTLELAKKLVELKVPGFIEVRTWYSNGVRGHYHSSRSCDKLKYGNALEHSLTPHAVFTSGKVVCKSCEHSLVNTEAARIATQTASFYAGVENSVNVLLDVMRDDPYNGYPALLALRYNTALRALHSDISNRPEIQGLAGWRCKAAKLVSSSILPEFQSNLMAESVRYSALKAVKHELDNSLQTHHSDTGHPLWGGEQGAKVCGPMGRGGRYSGNPLLSLQTMWFEQQAISSNTYADVVSNLLSDQSVATIVGKPASFDLLDFTSTEELAANETIAAFAIRAWSKQVTVIVQQVSDLWNEMYEQYAHDTNLVAVGLKVNSSQLEWGNSRVRGAVLPDPVILSQEIFRSSEGIGQTDTTVVVCPNIVATYIVKLCQNFYHKDPVIVPSLKDNYKEHADTAVALWVPSDRSSEFSSFAAAYAAASEL